MKINANFPGNPKRHGLPTIQGVIALFDASDGRVLALLDSIEITSIRTAAATAVAAKHLAREDASVVTICGCGEQGRSQLRAIMCVRPVRQVNAFDIDGDRAASYAREMAAELGVSVTAVPGLGAETRDTDIWITCTPAREWFLGRSNVRPGAFIAAVGADNDHKQEIEPELLASNVVIADVLDQCATIGDLHHALAASVMQREDVRAELADVVAGAKPGRLHDDEIIVFDSTGTALEDVAAAAVVYERALAAGAGITIDLGSHSTPNVVLAP
jgi:ornithine cyclodeaminase/alanine dehydrogenase-like protein (mu-crystallin family)